MDAKQANVSWDLENWPYVWFDDATLNHHVVNMTDDEKLRLAMQFAKGDVFAFYSEMPKFGTKFSMKCRFAV